MKKSMTITGFWGILFVLALSTPGTGIELPTVPVTITIDGDMTDWGPVLNNPVNVTEDGDGSSYGSNCQFSGDRDCEVKGGTGRDLLRFAWTYDSDNIYLYIQRWGSTSNIIRFFFVMDLGGDGSAENSDRVLLVEWSGVKNRYNAKLCAYIPDPAGSGSDSLTDGSGYADGYLMPGNIAPDAPLVTYTDVPGGNAVNGTEFEAAVSWADLGLSGPTPIMFHVASNNNANLNQAVDNMGGPNGGVGTFSFAGVDIYPSLVMSLGPGDLATLAHHIHNVGNQDGRFDLTGTSSLGLHLEYYTDPDDNGVGDDFIGRDLNGDGDFSDAGETLVAAYDQNVNGKPDFWIATGDTVHFVVAVQVPPLLNAVTDYLDFRVELESLIFVSDQVEDQLYIGYFTVHPDYQKSGVPGQYVDYGHRVTNNQDFADSAYLAVSSSMGWQVELYTDPNGDGNPVDGVWVSTDADGNGTWDSGNLNPQTPSLAPGGGTIRFVIRVRVPAGATPGTQDTTIFAAASVLNANRSGSAADVTTARNYVTLEPDYTLLYGAAGRSVYFPFVLVNSWTAADSFSLVASSDQGWERIIWSDPDGNGSIDDGAIIANTGLVPEMGGVFHLVVELRVSGAAQGGDQDTVTVTATSNLDPNQQASAVGQVEVSALQTFRGGYVNQATQFTTCETIYSKAYGLVPGQGTRYKLRYWRPGITTPLEDDLVSRADGTAVTSRQITAAGPPGAWTLEVWDTETSTAVDALTIQHERTGSVGPVVLSPDPALVGDDLRISVTFTNNNAGAPYSGTQAYIWVRAPSMGVLQDDGTFSTAPGAVTRVYAVPTLAAGASSTYIFTINDVAFPEEGVYYTAEVSWETVCGPQIGSFLDDQALYCIDCDDGFSCTDDAYGAGGCVSTQNDANCEDDGQYCNGEEICDPGATGHDPVTGCVSTGDPCPSGQTCYEDFDTCGCTDAGDCEDGFSCTDDSCNAAAGGVCERTYNHDNCAAGNNCYAAEVCDPGDPSADGTTGCVPGDFLCVEPTPFCDESDYTCVECLHDADCDDGIDCTNDICLASGDCFNPPDDDNCAAGNNCYGPETCDPLDLNADPVTGCVPGAFLCADPTPVCNPATGTCVQCLVDQDCTDGIFCTVNACVNNACQYTPDDTRCPDDGVYCNGAEACDAELDCISTGDPCTPAGYYCNEEQDRCDECQVSAHCNDGIACTVDSCVGGTCWNTPDDSRCPDDGLYCNGSEYCSAVSGCLHTGDPCAAMGLVCNEEVDDCGNCASDADCDDGVDCTDDTCVDAYCVFTPNDLNCTDDGVYCNGVEICNATSGCISTGDPCVAAGRICNEDQNRCDECRTSADCDDGLYCNGAETCVGGSCRPGTDPCDGQDCDEINDRCSACRVDADCDDGIYCNGAEYCVGGMCRLGMDPCPGQICNEARDECMQCSVDADCRDAWYCNGEETCQDGSCRPGVYPCPDQLCDEYTDTCVECLEDADCQDAFWCNGAEVCIDGACQPGPDPCPGLICDEAADSCKACEQDSDCDDGFYCNGVETCVAGLVCAQGTDPCPGQICDEENDQCLTCTQDSDCNDGLYCNGEETCDGGVCSQGANPCPPLMCDEGNNTCMSCLTDADCDDGLFCSGVEACIDGTCAAGTYPCPGQMCNEGSDSCGECLEASDCDDGLYCTGVEICRGGRCWSGADPCPGSHCDEGANACVECLEDDHCDDGMYCNGSETCVDGVCWAGMDPCPGQVCDELHNECQPCMTDADCDDGLWCNGAETCVGGFCSPGDEPCPGQLCDEENDQCLTCTQDSDCDNGVFCDGAETCAGGFCYPGDEPCPAQLCDEDADVCADCLSDQDCDDGLWCNGTELCVDGVCVDGMDDPCPSQICDENLDQCLSCTQDAECDDGVYCNGAETCVDGFCVVGGDPCPGMICDEANQRCMTCTQDSDCDDGLWCTGEETCYGGYCIPGSDPCPGQFCDETFDECTGCMTDADCDDGLWCTGEEACSGGYCIPGPPPCPGQVCDEENDRCLTCTQDSDCDDGWFCNGEEVCVDGTCYQGQDPCPGQVCNEARDECWACLLDSDCDDGLWCDGPELCYGGVCLQGSGPCGEHGCDEENDVCLECTTDHDCEDGQYCTGDRTCEGGLCENGEDPCPGRVCDEDTDSCRDCRSDAECDDGLYCNGAEICDDGACVSGQDPCPGMTCNEDFDLCVGCTQDSQCDDGRWCNGQESCENGVCWPGVDPCPGKVCDEDTDSCRDCVYDNECDDGLYCNGAETCTGGTCVGGVDPCPGMLCDESADRCMQCGSDLDCDDGIYCNGREVCFDGFCYRGQDPCPGQLCDENRDECWGCLQDQDCDDGLYCDGEETCVDGTCRVGEDPCPGRMCDETGDACVDCLQDQDCDDGLYCNGAEVCAGGQCWAGTDPCPDQMCDEVADACTECLVDAECDDGLYCNGAEVCTDGACGAGSDPCPGQFCNEDEDACAECVTHSDCDDGLWCNGQETCVNGACQPGTPPCLGACDEDLDICPCTEDAECDDGEWCNGQETCVDGSCQEGADPCPLQPCDEDRDECVDWWEERDVRGGGCECGTSGSSSYGPLLLLLLGLAVLRTRRRR